jgi:predicted MFS family arabinose efflux permease
VGPRRDRLLAETSAIRAVLANGDIGRLEGAWLATNAATSAFLVVTLVVAYNAGGALAAGLLGVVRYLPPTLVTPFAGIPAARWRPDRVLLAVDLGRAIAMALTAGLLIAGGPLPLLFVLVGVEASAAGLSRPLTMSLLPWLARTPGELVASNIASSAGEGLGTLLGPAIAGLLLATSGAIGGTAAAAGLMAIAVVGVASIGVPMIRASGVPVRLRAGLTGAVTAIRRAPAARLVVSGFVLQSLVRGMLVVLITVAAIERLGMGEPGVGTLNAAIGAGGFIGAVVGLSLTGRAHFSSTFALSLALWGLPIAVVGIVADPLAAVVLLAIVGMSNALLDVTGFTLLQRSTPNDARIGVMGILESLAAAAAAAGGLLASGLVSWLGIGGALVAAGAILPLAATITLPALRRAESRADPHEAESKLLRADPLLGLLSLSIVEELATVLEPADFEPGAFLIREGEAGDRYLIIASGEVEISQAGIVLGRLGPGHGVGEISLLRDVPRTASVRAVGPVTAFALGREAFLSAVTGHSTVRTAADTIVTEHLARSPVARPRDEPDRL